MQGFAAPNQVHLRVIKVRDDMEHTFQKGDILVTTATDNSFMPYIQKAFAIIRAVKPDCVIVQMQAVFSSAAVAHAARLIAFVKMLESMVNSPRPTRAEANDVANAIFDGSDAIMLSGETAMGNYPVEAVATMARIAQKAEGSMKYGTKLDSQTEPERVNITNAISLAACATAGLFTMLSSICVAVITGLPQRFAFAISIFCTRGTSSFRYL